jgi:protocatechuate 3,4-dioxygenase beta subunit
MSVFTIAASLLLLLQSATGSIEGNVLGSTSGKPVRAAKIVATRLATKTAGQAPTVTTDENGHFVFRSLEPGTYFLRAMADGYSQEDYGNRGDGSVGTATQVLISPGQNVKGITFHLIAGGAISGKVFGDGNPLSHIQVSVLRSTFTVEGNRLTAQLTSAETDDSGRYLIASVPPGRYYLVAEPAVRPAAGIPSNAPGTGNKYPRTFYPAAREVAGAKVIDVRADANIDNLDFQLMLQPTYHIRGRILDADGKPLTGRMLLALTSRDGLVSTRSANSTPFFSDGSGGFDIGGVTPGSYIVHAMSPAPATGQAPLAAGSFTDVRGADVEDVLIRFAPYVSVSGRIRVEGEGPVLDISRFSLILQPRDTWTGGVPIKIQKRAGGAFVFTGLTPGEYQIAVGGIPLSGLQDDLYLKAMRFGGKDVLTSPLSISEPVKDSLDVVLRRNGGRIRVTVQNSGRFVPAATVLLVPDQRERYDLYKYNNTGPTGICTFRGVAPGAYKIFAFSHIEQNSWFDPEVMRAYERFGSAIKIVESSMVDADLKLIDAPSFSR